MKRLEEVLNRLPSRLKLIFADLSFLTEQAQTAGVSKGLIWADGKLQSKGRTVVVASSSVALPSLSVEAGQHGLFTYQFLKALRGQADRNKDGWVDLGEVLSYLRDQASVDGTDRRPELVVLPDVDPTGPVGSFPLAKSRQ